MHKKFKPIFLKLCYENLSLQKKAPKAQGNYFQLRIKREVTQHLKNPSWDQNNQRLLQHYYKHLAVNTYILAGFLRANV